LNAFKEFRTENSSSKGRSLALTGSFVQSWLGSGPSRPYASSSPPGDTQPYKSGASQPDFLARARERERERESARARERELRFVRVWQQVTSPRRLMVLARVCQGAGRLPKVTGCEPERHREKERDRAREREREKERVALCQSAGSRSCFCQGVVRRVCQNFP
jgi:hypothetical protein